MKPIKTPRGGFSLAGPGRGVSAGRTAQRSGASFQQDIVRASAWYAARGLGDVVEIPTATVQVAGGKGRKFAARTGAIDFAGLVVGDVPYPVAFDAKVMTGHATLALAHADPRERSRTAKQVDFLLRFARMGGIAGYICLDREIGPDGALFWLDAAVLAPLMRLDVVAGVETPTIEIRTILPGPRKVPAHERMISSHPWCLCSSNEAVARGDAPRVPWRALALGARAFRAGARAPGLEAPAPGPRARA